MISSGFERGVFRELAARGEMASLGKQLEIGANQHVVGTSQWIINRSLRNPQSQRAQRQNQAQNQQAQNQPNQRQNQNGPQDQRQANRQLVQPQRQLVNN